MTLSDFFINKKKVALGFSGGVDSSYLLYAALKYGADVKPYFIKTQFQPEFELKDANRLAETLGIELSVLNIDILQNPDILENSKDRCYYCKKQLFSALKQAASKDGYAIIIDGNNASDDALDRPGMKAAAELSVLSPLRDCGIRKDDIRSLSKEAGLFTWDKPAYSCLATRIPEDIPITKESLKKIEKAEDILFELGFSDFRVRLLGEHARIQITEPQMEDILLKRGEILERLGDFPAVLLDLTPRA